MHKLLEEHGAKYVLVSYYYLREKGYKTVEHILHKFPDVFLDSGAFTLRLQMEKRGVNPSSSYASDEILQYIEDYAQFINEYGDKFSLVTEVDVGSWQQKTRNRQILLEKIDKNITVLPVVHRIDPNRYVEFLCEKYPYVAYAGLKGYSVAENKKYIAQRLLIAKKSKKPIHGFALTAVDIMRGYGLASVDSASWLHVGKHGMTFWFDGRHLRAYDKFNKWVRARFKNEVKSYGLNWDRFMDDHAYETNSFSLIQWLKFQDYIEQEGKLGQFKNKQEKFWKQRSEEYATN